MSEEQTTQTAVDTTDATAQQVAGAGSARTEDELAASLAEFEAANKKSSTTTATKPETNAGGGDESKAVLEQLKGLLAEQANEKFRRDMNETIKSVRGDLDAEFFDDEFVEAWLDKQAKKDQRLVDAWNARASNPEAFQKVVETLGRNFTKKYGKLPDRQATEDRAAVTAAVRGASTKAPEGKAPDFKGMSDAEYRESVRKEYGFTPL